MKLILFLDFEGALHPQPCFQDNVFCRLPLLAVLAGFEPECPHLPLTSAATGFGLVDQQSQRHMISARLS